VLPFALVFALGVRLGLSTFLDSRYLVIKERLESLFQLG